MFASTEAELLLPSSPGVVGEVTVALLVTVVLASAVVAATVTVTLRCTPLPIVPRLHSSKPDVA